MAEKMKLKEHGHIDGMNVNAIRSLMRSDKTPIAFKKAWAKKLDKMGVKL